MTAYSLRRRLLLWLLLATAALGVLALADTWREARLTAQGVSDRVLAGSALAIAERVTVDEGGGLEADIPYSSLEMLTSTAQDQVFYRVDGPGGVFLTGYDTLPAVAPGRDGIGFADSAFGGVPLRIATLARTVSSGRESIPFTVTVAESTLARDALARRILLRSALRLAALALVGAAVVWLAVTVALRPLDRLGAVLAARSPDDLAPLHADTPQEVAGLVDAINGFMARLDHALQALRNFTGNASHQLRTPLATLRTQLALAARSDHPDDVRAAVQKADAATARAERVLAQLLVLARVDATARQGGFPAVDIAELARSLTAQMVPDASTRGIDLGFEGPDRAMIDAEPVLFQEMLANLVDNALRHAGRGAVVTVRVRSGGGNTVVEVEDDGPGLGPAQVAAFRRGQRGRRGAATDVPGQGFGLAIVREIAGLLAGEVTVGPPPGGRGLAVAVRFPAAPG